MILKTDKIKNICNYVLPAIDNSGISKITNTLELYCENNVLNLCITNNEYYVKALLTINQPEEFHATINASLFLNLMSKVTSETVELIVDNSSLNVFANGEYKIPLIFDEDCLLTLTEIDVNNVTVDFNTTSDVLKSIDAYNTKELQKGVISNPVQRLYYVDEKGAITFTSGACVNNFSLSTPVKLLLNQKLVKLFKLCTDEEVNVKLGHESYMGDTITKVKFSTDNVIISAILTNDDTMLSSIPVDIIRERALDPYPYTICLSKKQLLDCIDRLMLFKDDSLKVYSKFEFNNDLVKIYSMSNLNFETNTYLSKTLPDDFNSYECMIDLNDIKLSLTSFNSESINIKFGNSKCVVVYSDSVFDVIPEIIEA